MTSFSSGASAWTTEKTDENRDESDMVVAERETRERASCRRDEVAETNLGRYGSKRVRFPAANAPVPIGSIGSTVIPR